MLGTRDLAVVPYGRGGRDPIEAAPNAVYFITDRNMQLLYVGCTTSLMVRLKHHATKDWFTPDCHIFTEWFVDHGAAEAREAHAIADGNPKHNQRVPSTTDPDPNPDIPLRQLRDLDRDVAGCISCGDSPVGNRGLCGACYREYLDGR